MTTIVKKENLSSVFPNICTLQPLPSESLLPLLTVRGFSALNRIKTPLSNRLSNKITVQLLFISIEGPCLEDFDFNAACLEWASKRNRCITIL